MASRKHQLRQTEETSHLIMGHRQGRSMDGKVSPALGSTGLMSPEHGWDRALGHVMSVLDTSKGQSVIPAPAKYKLWLMGHERSSGIPFGEPPFYIAGLEQ